MLKTNKNAPYAPKTHDLLYLAQKLNLELTTKQKNLLDTITKFNIEARYDDYKETFKKICTNQYVTEQIQNIKEVQKWLKNLLTMK